jgi:hypothetical protein
MTLTAIAPAVARSADTITESEPGVILANGTVSVTPVNATATTPDLRLADCSHLPGKCGNFGMANSVGKDGWEYTAR